MNVRPANLHDLPTIVRFNQLLADETEGIQLDPIRLQAGVEAVLNDPSKGRYLVAEIDGRVAGQLMTTYEWSDWRNGVIWWIQSVYVEAPFRAQGVFRSLYEGLEREARAAPNVSGIRLYVETHNERAQTVYEKMGMRRAPYHVYEVDFVIERA